MVFALCKVAVRDMAGPSALGSEDVATVVAVQSRPFVTGLLTLPRQRTGAPLPLAIAQCCLKAMI